MRSELKLCRLCATHNENISSIELFERPHKYILRKVFQLSGIKLKNQKCYPSVVCLDCEMELNRAYNFRERCITAQAYYSSSEYKTHIIMNYKEKDLEPKSQYSGLTLVKFEVKPCINENETPTSNFERSVQPTHSKNNTPEEFIAVNENFNTESVHEDKDELDHGIDSEKDKSVYCDKIVSKSETDMKTPIKENEVLEMAITNPVLKVRKVAHKQKNTRLRKLGSNASEENKIRKPKIYICDQCGNKFKYRSHFLTHIKRHTGIKPLQCEVCPNKFFTEGELKRHMRRHTGERPFSCQYCDRRFTDYSTRIKHERTHTNDRPFMCQQCGKAFTTNYVLKNHMLVHSGERSYGCTLCKKSFQRQTHLVVHTRSAAHQQNVEREQYKQIQAE